MKKKKSGRCQKDNWAEKKAYMVVERESRSFNTQGEGDIHQEKMRPTHTPSKKGVMISISGGGQEAKHTSKKEGAPNPHQKKKNG